MAKVQRKLAQADKGTPKRTQARMVVARIHERIRFKRHDFAHQLAHRLVSRYGTLVIEDLTINGMVHNPCLSKSHS